MTSGPSVAKHLSALKTRVLMQQFPMSPTTVNLPAITAVGLKTDGTLKSSSASTLDFFI